MQECAPSVLLRLALLVQKSIFELSTEARNESKREQAGGEFPQHGLLLLDL
jgi:hypothetical protein